MEQCCRLRYLVAVLVAAEIVLVVISVNSISGSRGRLRELFFMTPSTSDLMAMNGMVDDNNDTVDKFLANYTIYCEKNLIPYVINIRHYSRETPLCPCIPSDLGMCFVHNIW